MTGHARKRAAYEPAARLVGVGQELAAAPAKRPISTALGAVFVMARALVGALWLVAFALVWKDLAIEDDLGPAVGEIFLWSVLIVGGIALLVLLVLGWLIWRGSNAARVLVMLGLTLSITVSAIDYFFAGEEITIQTTLLTVAFDILVLLALSSRDARAWARRPRGGQGRDRA